MVRSRLGIIFLTTAVFVWVSAQIAFWQEINVPAFVFWSGLLLYFIGAYYNPGRFALFLAIFFMLVRIFIAIMYFAFSRLIYDGFGMAIVNLGYVLLSGFALVFVFRRRLYLKTLGGY